MNNWSVYHQTQQTKHDLEHSWIPNNLRVHHEVKKFGSIMRDEPFEYRVDISKYLQDQKQQVGQVIVVVVPTDAAFKKTSGSAHSMDDRPMASAWIQVTHLSLDPFQDGRPGNTGVVAWVNDLATGRPITGATVTHRSSAKDVSPNSSGVTDARGLVRIKAKQDPTGHAEQAPLVATLGTDTVFLSHYQVWNNKGIRIIAILMHIHIPALVALYHCAYSWHVCRYSTTCLLI
jgi:hypothetical protein